MHTRARESGRREQRGPRKYDLRLWRDEIRPAQLERQPLCEHCLERGIRTAATDVDHVDGDNTNDEPGNLQSLCHSCHSIKTEKHDGSFGK